MWVANLRACRTIFCTVRRAPHACGADFNKSLRREGEHMNMFRTRHGTAVAPPTSLPSAESGIAHRARLEFHCFANEWQEMIKARLIRFCLVSLAAITTVT